MHEPWRPNQQSNVSLMSPHFTRSFEKERATSQTLQQSLSVPKSQSGLLDLNHLR